MWKWSRALVVVLVVALAAGADPASAKGPKPPCVASLADCPDAGCGGGDAELNKRKNLTDAATHAEDWTVGDVVDLEVPHLSRNESREAAEELGEGSAVRVSGYLIYGDKTKTPESCNCYLRGPENNDFHLNLVEHKKDEKSESVVVEITPRFRPQGWDLSKIKALAKRSAYVRVTGYLLLDTMHTGQSQGRATAWEIHPVTACEVCTKSVSQCEGGKGWKPLASYEP